MCHQCGRSGSWAQLEDQLSLRRPGAGRRAARLPPDAAAEDEPPSLPAAAARLWEAAQPADALPPETLQPALERLGLQVRPRRAVTVRVMSDGTHVRLEMFRNSRF